jgi:homoserine O-acetyltransferase
MTNSNRALRVETKFFTLAREGSPFVLTSGLALEEAVIAYETYGELNSSGDNAVLICHGFTADAHAAGLLSPEGDRPGWWSDMIGAEKAFDTNRYFVISSNSLGGCKGSTGPSSINPKNGRPYGASFPDVSIEDMVCAQNRLLESLGVTRLACVTGASMGGQQALQWLVSHPEFVKTAIPIACSARLDAQGLAVSEISRRAIVTDPEWRNGDYYGHSGPLSGLAVARMAAHLTYISPQYLHAVHGRKRDKNGNLKVQSMMIDEGRNFIKRFDANSFLTLASAIDRFDLTNGDGSLEGVFASVGAEVLLVSFSTDVLFPSAGLVELEAAMKRDGVNVRHVQIETIYGHDAFLTDWRALSELVKDFLG